MKRLLLVLLILCLMPSISNAVMVDTKASGSTITFSTVVNIATFNSVTNFILFRNESTTSDCYIILDCAQGVALRDTVLKLPASGTQTPNTVTLNFATDTIGFISDRQTPASSVTSKVSYTVTADKGTL